MKTTFICQCPSIHSVVAQKIWDPGPVRAICGSAQGKEMKLNYSGGSPGHRWSYVHMYMEGKGSTGSKGGERGCCNPKQCVHCLCTHMYISNMYTSEQKTSFYLPKIAWAIIWVISVQQDSKKNPKKLRSPAEQCWKLLPILLFLENNTCIPSMAFVSHLLENLLHITSSNMYQKFLG